MSKIKIKKFCNSSCAASYNNKGVCRNKNCNDTNINTSNKNNIQNKLDRLSNEEIISAFKSSNTLLEFSQKLGYKGYINKKSSNIIKRLDSLGIDLDIFKKSKNNNTNKNKTCILCGCKLSNVNKTGYCYPCYVKNNNLKKIENWLETGETGCSIGSNIRNGIRDYLYDDQNFKCKICGIENRWNGKKLIFILDHIDGDASNNNRENLRLICPNCDSQLDTYKSKNKNSARNYRHQYYEKYNKNNLSNN